MKKNNNIKVLLGLSGGVDSAIALYLLKRKGYNVDALFMRNWDSALNNDILGNPNDFNDICPQEKDYMDAKEIADFFNVKLLRVDFVEEYYNKVFNDFLEEYKRGRTPNPDVLCNNYIKFDAFLNYALNNGYDFIATGHYAKLVKSKKRNKLLIPKDTSKDQTYFLAQLKNEQLNNVIFPLSNILKKDVRKISSELKLKVTQKKDSTGICFIGERNFSLFLKNYLSTSQGQIKRLNNEIIGEHNGLFLYTIGQRKGLSLGTINKENGPWYVVGKDHKNNILYVDNNKNQDILFSNKAILYNFITRKNLTKTKCKIRFRHLQKLISGIIIKTSDNNYVITYDKQRAVTPGQLAAIYVNKECIGAGFIDRCYYNDKERMY